jgi:anthranilate synthase/aminodeoxychorismate synthase-like glutamine amidotransferase
MRVLVIDNYDSFTFNLVQALGELGVASRVLKNDEIGVEGIAGDRPRGLLISPGPCAPEDAGISLEAIARFAGAMPILGVCLGHQAIAQAFGARIVRAQRLMHGKASPIEHDGTGLFSSLPSPFEATRYHSLAVDRATLPEALRITAWTADGEIMGLRHAVHDVEGVQFHPESILTLEGKKLLANWVEKLG